MNSITNSAWVPLAHLLRPQGRRGELLAEPLSDLPGIFETGRSLVLAAADTSTPEARSPAVTLEDAWFPTGKNAGRIVLKLSGCDSISDAEKLSGKQLLLARTELPTLDPDTFFVGDLVGCTVFDGDTPVGTISDIEFATGPDGRTRLPDAAPLFAVQPARTNTDSPEIESETVLIPFIRAWLDSVDIPGRRIVMHLPPGLVDSDPDLPSSEAP